MTQRKACEEIYFAEIIWHLTLNISKKSQLYTIKDVKCWIQNVSPSIESINESINEPEWRGGQIDHLYKNYSINPKEVKETYLKMLIQKAPNST